ncbi:hypothetical protein K3495_g10398 [Podosphaera aphanis]|nr:hypothetical protein K3495_g10398 [Podosphaera aphanis]
MWSHNSFGNNGPFPNGFSQEDFMFPANSFPNSSATKQSFAPRPHHDVLIDLCSSNGQSNSGYLSNSYQPEVGLYNQQAFDLDSQSVSPIAQCNPSISQTTNPSSRPTAPQISSRAAELKAQLLARRGSSATSPSASSSGMPGLSSTVNIVNQETSKNTSSSRPSPHVPLNTEKREQELKLNDLISQYSDSKPTSSPKVKQDNASRQSCKSTNNPKPPHPQKISSQVQQQSSNKTDLKDSKPVNTNKASETSTNKEPSKRLKKKKETESDASEGEIIEERESSKPVPPAKQNGKKGSSNISKSEQNVLQKSTMEQTVGKPRNRAPPQALSPCPSQKSVRREITESEPNTNVVNVATSQGDKNNSKDHQEQGYSVDAGTYRRPHHIDRTDNTSGSENNSDHGTENCSQAPDQEHLSTFLPNLADILPHNTDLREWLEITGYHNASYRNKILARRRAIAALDAQREKLLAEIEAEERGGLSMSIGTPYQPPSMLPPPIPSNRLRCQAESTPINSNSSPMIDASHHTASNKRPLSSIQDSYVENGPGKIARIEEKKYSPSLKDEERSEIRNSKSNGHDSTKSHISDEREEKDLSRPRLNGSGSSRDRNISPAFQVLSRKNSTRAKRHENDPYDDDDISETGSRPFEVRGNYRGRSFNPNYRGRGRGRGRGEVRDRSPVSRGEGSHGPRTGTSKSHKNSRGRGDKGSSH